MIAQNTEVRDVHDSIKAQPTQRDEIYKTRNDRDIGLKVN